MHLEFIKREPTAACILNQKVSPIPNQNLTSQEIKATHEEKKSKADVWAKKGQFLGDWQGLASNPQAVAAVVMVALPNKV